MRARAFENGEDGNVLPFNKPKPKERRRFAAIPPRAAADTKLSAVDWRVLVAIACHDLMGKGQGCWASSTTIAQESGTRADSVRRSITKLIRLGYLRREAREGRAQRTLYMVHDDDPTLATCGTPCHTSEPRRVANDARRVAPHATQRDSPYGEEEIAQSASSTHADALRLPAEIDQRRNAAEAGSRPEAASVRPSYNLIDSIGRAHPSKLPANNDGQFLRYCQDWIDRVESQGGIVTEDDYREAERSFERCLEIEDRGEPKEGTGHAGWATGLAPRLGSLLDECTAYQGSE